MTRARWLGPRREATVAAIVACLTPEFPAVRPEVRAAVLSDVTRFVSSQVQALPDFLRVPYKQAILVFEWLPLLRWGRRFRALDEERRAAYVAMWSYARVGALRNFVKLIRGCALLAYYDHPALVEALEAQAGRTATPPLRTAAGTSA